MTFVLFIIKPNLAQEFWILLIIYTEFVLLLLFGWQTHATIDMDKNTAARLFGLQHFDPLVSWGTGKYN